MLIEQHRAFATDGFRDEEMLAHGHGRGMELVELQIGHLGSGADRRGQSVTRRYRRIGGVRVQTSGAAGGEHHTVRIHDTRLDAVLVVPHRQTHTGHVTVAHQHVVQERVLEHGDVRIGFYHGGNVEFQDLSGGIPSGVHHTGAAVRGFEAAQHVAFTITVHMPSVPDEFAHAASAFVGQYADGGAVAQSMARCHGVGRMQRRRIIIEDRGGHASLGVVCVRFDELVLAYEQHLLGMTSAVPGDRRAAAVGQSLAAETFVTRRRERRAQACDARSDHNDHGCTSSMRCNAILASRAVSSSTVMRLTMLPCSMFSNAHAR